MSAEAPYDRKVLRPLADDLAAASLAMARRFAAGATLWCAAPEWPHHAHHVAVEFVHPVIVGKRALPAVRVPSTDPLAALRVLTRPGDVLVAIARADDPAVLAAFRRAPVWGLTTIWMGAGVRPEAGAADYVLWLDEPGADAPGADGPGADGPGADASHDGRCVLLYHLLWELTHVCFEHPGLLGVASHAGKGCDDGMCVTCRDEGLLGEVVAGGAESAATVRTARGAETVDTSLVGLVEPGDLVLVHAGAALTRVDDGDGTR